MSHKIASITDIKPKVALAVDTKPLGGHVSDIKPKLNSGAIQHGDRLYTVTINAGQSMGLLLALTYPAGFTVISSKAP